VCFFHVPMCCRAAGLSSAAVQRYTCAPLFPLVGDLWGGCACTVCNMARALARMHAVLGDAEAEAVMQCNHLGWVSEGVCGPQTGQ
jgi:hypothetical protein